MAVIDHNSAIVSARSEVLSWLLGKQFGFYKSDAELVKGFTSLVAQETDLELRTRRNPNSSIWEARWYNAGRELEEFRKPFCADEENDASLVACAAMLRLK
jgi:hypothetical protein